MLQIVAVAACIHLHGVWRWGGLMWTVRGGAKICCFLWRPWRTPPATSSDVVLEARPWPRGQILRPWPRDSWPWPRRSRPWPWTRGLALVLALRLIFLIWQLIFKYCLKLNRSFHNLSNLILKSSRLINLLTYLLSVFTHLSIKSIVNNCLCVSMTWCHYYQRCRCLTL